MSKKIYKTRPLSYRQWGQIKKEMYQLVGCIALLVLFGGIVNVLAAWLIQVIK